MPSSVDRKQVPGTVRRSGPRSQGCLMTPKTARKLAPRLAEAQAEAEAQAPAPAQASAPRLAETPAQAPKLDQAQA
jgi:hypothetical protein